MVMKKRGVSPVIATILLIGIVIVIALIVFLWLRGMQQEAITKFEGMNVEIEELNMLLTTQEGPSAVKEAIQFLR